MVKYYSFAVARKPALLFITATILTIATTLIVLLMVYSAGRNPLQSMVLTAVGIVFVLCVFFLPSNMLPAFSLGTFIAFPPGLMPGVFTYISPGALVMVVWLFRHGLHKVRFLGTTFKYFYGIFILVVLLSLLGSVDKTQSLLWIVAFLGATFPSVYLEESERAVENLLKFWQFSAVVLGLYGLAESILGFNPIYGAIYRMLGVDGQHWATYRPYLSFGHPIPAASFMAVTAAIMVVVWMQQPTRKNLIVMVSSVIGLLVPLTRGGYLAFLVALSVGLLYVLFTRAGTNLRKRGVLITIVGLVAVTLILSSDRFLERFTSDEASGALVQRLRTIPIVLEASSGSGTPLGAGPGMSNVALGYEMGTLRYIENAYLQALLSFGWLGALLFVLFLLGLALFAWRKKNLIGLCAASAFAISIATYNALDGHYSIFVLLGCVVLLVKRNVRLGSQELEPSQVLCRFYTGSGSRSRAA